jgi:hypothetical protein
VQANCATSFYFQHIEDDSMKKLASEKLAEVHALGVVDITMSNGGQQGNDPPGSSSTLSQQRRSFQVRDH